MVAHSIIDTVSVANARQVLSQLSLRSSGVNPNHVCICDVQ